MEKAEKEMNIPSSNSFAFGLCFCESSFCIQAVLVGESSGLVKLLAVGPVHQLRSFACCDQMLTFRFPGFRFNKISPPSLRQLQSAYVAYSR